ncbi:hypothetical protein [Candidatus Uabimicrobium amorphum]|nr:hypothetical protein [Candidatus Uabimicrobium amorphum]
MYRIVIFLFIFSLLLTAQEFNSDIKIKTTGNSANLYLYNGKGNQWQIGGGEAGCYLYDRVGNRYTFFSDNSGRVGIGTTKPTEKLHVSGDVKIKTTGNSANLYLYNGKGNQWQIGGGEAGCYLYDRVGNRYTFFSDNSGRVGIGTTKPTEKLHVSGDVKIKTTGNSANLYLYNGKGNQWQIGGGEAGCYLYDRVGNRYTFFSDNSGRVGIGTTKPTAKLHVHGSAKFVTYPANNVGVQVGHENGNAPFIGNLGGDYGLNIVTKGQKRIHVATDGFVHVYSNLNVNGILNVTNELEVKGKSGFHSTVQTNNNDILLYTDTAHGVGVYHPAKPFNGFSSSGPVVYGYKGGALGTTVSGQKVALQWNDHNQVGINCKPFGHYELAVNGEIIATKGLEVKGKSDFHSTVQTNNNDILLYTDAAHGVGVYHPAKPFNGFASSGPVVYGYKGGALGTTVSGQKVALQWNDNNQVGINCKPHQNYELAVNGQVIATEIVVESGWADFVFDDDYKLMPLEEVEQQINKNKHLPDIPSEEEIKAKGVPIGKMQAKLLQKIEELTLYTIQQNQQIKQQNKQIQFLKLQNENLYKKTMEISNIKRQIKNMQEILIHGNK